MRDKEHCSRMIELYKKAYKRLGLDEKVIDKALEDRYELERQYMIEEEIDSFINRNKRQPVGVENTRIVKRACEKTKLSTEEILEVYEKLWDYIDYRPVDDRSLEMMYGKNIDR